ncbi:hypothetical protein HJC99_04455 [Candidatus Saccharibacteria bacterium]|nr:hypothetical protein [Candidatus Saccharibacteria bacterium]
MQSRIARVAKANLRRTLTSLALATGLFAVTLAGTLAAFTSQPANAAVGINHEINFQGKIVNSDGTNVANGTYSFTFKLYSVATGGSAVWTEVDSLPVTDGVFQVQLGAGTTLPGSVDFNSDGIYLGINFNPGTGYDGEMSPRIQLTAAAYAFNSEKLGGLTAASFAQLSPASAQSGFLNVTGNVTSGATVAATTALQAPLVDTASAVALNVGTGTASSVTVGRATSSNAVTIQGSNASTWVVTGASGTTTLSFAAPTATNAIQFPNAGGTVCTTVASTCSATYQTSSGSGSYIAKNANDTSTASYVGSLLALSNTSTGAAGVLSLANSGTGAALMVTSSATPTSGNALIVANAATGVTGNLIDLQLNAVSKFSVATTGAVTTAGAINGQTISSAASFTGTVTAATSFLTTLIDTPTAGGTLAIGTTNATGGITLAQNTTVANNKTLQLSNSTATNAVFGSQVSGDTNNRFNINADGKLTWGSGSGAIDVSLSRSASGTLSTSQDLTVGTASVFNAKLSVQSGSGTGQALVVRANASQSVDVFQIQDSAGVVHAAFNTIGNQLTLGKINTSGTVSAGTLVLGDGTTDGFGATVNTSTLTANRTLQFPDAGGTLCTTVATTCSSVYAPAGTGYLAKNANDSSTAAYLGQLYAFSNTNTGASGTLGLTAAGTNSALSITQSGNPTSGQALILANNTNGTPSGNLLDLQVGAVSKFSVSYQGVASAATSVNTPLLDNSAGAIGIGTGTGSTTVTIGKTSQSVVLPGNLALNGALTGTSSAKLQITGSISSTSTGQQVAFQNQVDFNPQGASAGTIYGLINIANISGSSLAIPALIGSSTGVSTGAGYTGTVADARGLSVASPAIGGSQLFTTYSGEYISGNSANGGNTTGSITNRQLVIQGITAGAGTGGTLSNYGINLTQPSGSGGTTANYGLFIAGAGASTTNYSIYNSSTAASYYAGNVLINTLTNANNYPLNVSGTIGASDIIATATVTGTTKVITPLVGTADSTTANTAGVTLRSGNASTGTNLNSGSVTIDSGTHTGTGSSGSVLIGQTNAGAVLLGNSSAQFTMQGAASTSSIIANNGATSTKLQFTNPTANVIYNIPTATAGTYNICTAVAASCSGTYQAAGNYLLQNPAAAVTSTSNFTGAQYTFVQNNSAASTALALQSAGTNAAFSVVQSGNPTSGQALILANNTNGTPSGNLLDLQSNAVSKFSVSATGAVASASTINLQTISATANFTGTITSANTVTVTTGGINVTGTSTIAGTLGGLTGLTVASGGASITGSVNLNSSGITNAGAIAGASTIAASTSVSAPIVSSADTSTASTNSVAVAFRSGNASGTTSNSGAVTVDAGTATGTPGAVNVGTGVTTALNVGRVAAQLSLQGSATSTIGIGNGTNTTTINFTNPTGNATYTLGTAATGSYNICTTVAASCSSVYQAAGSYIAKNAVDTSSATLTAGQTLLTLSNGGGTGSSVLQVNNGTATGAALYVTAAANPSAGNALLVANNTNGTPSGNLLDLQVSATSKFSVNYQGNVTSGTVNGQTLGAATSLTGTLATAGAINGQTITAAASFTGTVTVATGVTVTAGGETITAGGLNLTSTGITNAGAIAGATTVAASTSVTTPSVDNTAGLVVGGANATSVQLGHGTIVTSIQGSTVQVGAAGASILKNNGATFDAVCAYTGVSGSKTLNTAGSTPDVCSVFDITDTAATTITVPAPAAGAGSIVYLSNMPTSATPFTLLGSQVSVGSTATLVYNGTNWTYAGADASGLQTGYNNSVGSTTPEILLDTTRNGVDVQDANTTLGANVPLLAVRASATASTLGSALLSVTNTGVGINLGAANTVTGGGDLQFGGTAARTIAVQDQATTATAGAALTIKSAAGNTSGAGGALTLSAGAGGTSGVGGAVAINGGGAGGGNTPGGAVTITGGAATGTGTGGLVTIQGGSAAATAGSIAGGVVIQAANGTATGAGGIGGALNFNAGDAGGTGNNAGGNITLLSGANTGTGVPGTIVAKTASNSTTGFQVQNSTGTAILSVDSAAGTTSATNTSATSPYTAMIVNSGTTGYSGLRFGNLNSTTGSGSNATSYNYILGVDSTGNVGLSNVAVSLTSPALAYWDGINNPTVTGQSYPLATLSGSASYISGTGIQLTPATNGQSGSVNWSFAQVPFEETQFQFKAGGGTGADSTWFYSYADGTPTTEYGAGFTKGYIIYFSEYHGCVGVAYGGYSDGNQCGSGGGTSPLASTHISNIGDNTYHDVDIQLLYNEVIVRWDGIVILDYSDVYTRDTSNQNFGFGARTGGSNNVHDIKGLLVTKLGTNVSNYGIDSISPLAQNLNYNNSTNALGVNTNAPTSNLEVDGTAAFEGQEYNTGTVCQQSVVTCSSAGTPPTAVASTNVWGTGTAWTSAMVGDKITFANGVTDTVASVVSGTNLTVTGSRVVFSGTYRLNRPNTLVINGNTVTVGGTLQVGSTTTDATATLFGLDSYNNATDPTGAAGAMYYNTSKNAFRCYQDGAWTNCTGFWQTLNVAADEARTSTTATNDTYLTFPIAANSNYTVRCQLYWSATSTGGFRSLFTGPTGPTSVDFQHYGIAGGATVMSDIGVNVAAGTTQTLTSTANSGGYMTWNGQWNNGTTAGTWILKWGLNTAVGTTTLRQGSYCDYGSF